MYSVLTLGMDGVPYGPVKLASTNANQTLPASIITNSTRNAIHVVITCEDHPVRYAFGGVIPVSAGVGHVLAVNESLVIGHPAGIASFRFISSVANSHGNLQITGEYGAS